MKLPTIRSAPLASVPSVSGTGLSKLMTYLVMSVQTSCPRETGHVERLIPNPTSLTIISQAPSILAWPGSEASHSELSLHSWATDTPRHH